jgi:dipeptidyl aminopeptidase/acylaminoacyl peptidase
VTRWIHLSALLLLLSSPAAAEPPGGYQRPAQPVLDVLHATPLPVTILSPPRDGFLLLRGKTYPPISDLAEPMLRLAGVRLNPITNGPHRAPYWTTLSYLPLGGGAESKITGIPESARIGSLVWSADGARFAFTNTIPEEGVELWVGEVATRSARRIEGARLNQGLGSGIKWMPDQRTILTRLVPGGRGDPPASSTVPIGPSVQEGSEKKGIGSTYETRDVLRGPADEARFDYYMTAQLALVDAATGRITPIGAPDLYVNPDPSPDGNYLYLERLRRPYSYLHPHQRFPRDVEIWDRGTGAWKRLRTIASIPLADQIPIHGVATGLRHAGWQATEPATLVWVEALDGGDPLAKVSHRDRILAWSAPFHDAGEPRELLRLEQRFAGLYWGEGGRDVLVAEYDRERRWERMFRIRPVRRVDIPEWVGRKLLWEQSVNEKYKDPGDVVQRFLPSGAIAFQQDGAWIWLAGNGATPDGDRPFLDRYNLDTGDRERVFRCDRESYESYIGILDWKRGTILTRRESPRDPPNFHIRTLGAAIRNAPPGEAARRSKLRAVTRFEDPTPVLRGITREIVTYTRDDGVPLSFTLHLPSGYRKGTRLPTVVYAYPLEYSDKETAGQVSGSERRFTLMGGASHLFFLLQGYAVLSNTTMPVIAHPDSVYNNFVEQLVSSAKAAVDKAVSMGIADPERVGIMGHSHGGRTAATLLAHSDLFRAGIARSGAYNQTLVPFGFQGERRTFFDTPDTYLRVSAFRYAHQIDEPLLLIHGEADANPGTLPFQSDLMYRAVVGTGGTARLVMLPLESHGYEARESIEHTLWEMITWFDRYVKNAAPRVGAREPRPTSGENAP